MNSFGKLSGYFIWLGLALLVAGLVMATAVQSLAIAASICLALGLLLLLLGISVQPQIKHLLEQLWTKRAIQKGVNSLFAAIAVLLILGCLNFLAAQFPLRIDLTENQLHTLSSQTKSAVQSLEQPLKIWLFQEMDDANLTPLLENYHRLNPGKVQYDFVDPDRDIRLINQFQVKNRGEVHLEYGDKTQLVQVLTQGEPLTESQLTNSIIRIKGDRQPHLYLLQGHGEPPLNGNQGGLMQMAQALETQGYRVSSLNLAQTPTLPDDATAIALIAPRTPLLPGEVQLLQEHLQQHNGLLILIDPQTNPQLDPLLKDWGITLDQSLLLDEDTRADFLGLGQSTLIITNYGDHPITTALQNQISTYQDTRPISFTPKEAIIATPILSTDNRTWAESNPQSPNPSFNTGGDRRGPLDFGLALERTFPPQQNTDKRNTTARLVVIGNSTFVTNGWFEQYFNGDILLNSVNWLTQTETAPLAIRPKEPQNRRLNPSGLQVALIAWLAPILFPLGGLISAGILLWRRR